MVEKQEKITEEIIQIEISNYTVTFYGGNGYQGKIRAMIALYDKQAKLTAFVRFYNNDVSPEKDYIDENGLFIMNVPGSSYLDIIYSLRSNRAINLIFTQGVAMLCEYVQPRVVPVPPNIDTSKIN